MGSYRESEYYDDIYNRYVKYHSHYTASPYYSLWLECLNFIRDDAKILEVGCGTGQFLKLLQDKMHFLKGYEGFDFSPKAIELCNSGLVKIGDARNPKMYEGDYDLIVSMEVMEHLKDDVEVIRLWPKNKLVLITVPEFDDPAHVRYFTSIDEIIKRYEVEYYCLKIMSVLKHDRWYIIHGFTI